MGHFDENATLDSHRLGAVDELLVDFPSPLIGTPRALPPDEPGLYDLGFEGSVDAFTEAFKNAPGPIKAFDFLMHGSFDRQVEKAITQYHMSNPLDAESEAEDYDPADDLRFAKLPPHMWDFALQASTYKEGTVILRMLQKQLEKQQRIASSGFAGTAGTTLGYLAGEAPVFLLSGPAALAIGFPAVTGFNETFQQLQDPTRSFGQSAVSVGISGGFGIGFGVLSHGLRTLKTPRMSPMEAEAFAKIIDDEIAATEIGVKPRSRTPTADSPAAEHVTTRTFTEATTQGEVKDSIREMTALLGKRLEAQAIQGTLKQRPDGTLYRLSGEHPEASVMREKYAVLNDKINDLINRPAYSIEEATGKMRAVEDSMDNLEAFLLDRKIITNFRGSDFKNLDDLLGRLHDAPVSVPKYTGPKFGDRGLASQARDKRGGKTTQSTLSELQNVDTKAGMIGAINRMLDRRAIDVGQARSMRSMVDAMPENFFIDLAVGAEWLHPGRGVRGMYYYFEDVVAVFGEAIGIGKGQAGKTLAHEITHRVMFTMATEEELLIARGIFDNYATSRSTSESLKAYPNKADHFSEWFAFEGADYWVRRLESGEKSALNWLGQAYGKDALGLANMFEAMAVKLVELTRRLAGKPGFEATQAHLIDTYFTQLTRRIGKENAQKMIQDIDNLSFARSIRFADEADFLTGPRGDPNIEIFYEGGVWRPDYWRPNLKGATYDRIGEGKPVFDDFVPADDANKLMPAFLLEHMPDLSPVKQMLQGSSAWARHVASYIVEHPYYQKKNAAGELTGEQAVTVHGVDAYISERWMAPMVEAQKASDGLYNAYRERFFNEIKGDKSGVAKPHKSTVAQLGDDLVRGRGGAITRTEFMEQVYRAKIRTEPGANGQTALEVGLEPEAIQAANIWAEKIFNKAGRQAQEHRVFSFKQDRRRFVLEARLQKLLDDTDNSRGMTVPQLRFMESLEKQIKELKAEGDAANTFKLDPNYVIRIWNKTKIKANRPRLHAIIMERGGYTAQEAAARIDSILTGKAFQAIDDDATGVARSLKERQINVDTIYVEDFVEKNMASVGRYYATRMGADIELVRQFGSVDMKEIFVRMRQEYNDLIESVEPGYLKRVDKFEKRKREAQKREIKGEGDITKGAGIEEPFPLPRTKEGKAMLKESDRMLENGRALRDRVRGTYGIPDDPSSYTNRGIRIAKMFNAMTLLTGALAATPDLAKLIMTDGPRRLFGTSLEAYKSQLGFLKTAKLAKFEANLAGEALDMYLAMRSALFADLADSLSAATPFERTIGNVTQQSFNVNLMNQWNEGVKTMASLISGSRMIAESENLLKGTISKTERIKLNNVGISPDVARVIVDQTKKHGLVGEEGFVRIAKTHLWDAEAREAAGIYTRALGKEIRRTIVTPGKGEAPLFMSKPIWTLVLQFKTFAIAATHRTLIPGLQLRDQNFLLGMIATTGLGALVHEIRRYQLGIKRDEKFGDWLVSVTERGGGFGALMDLNQALETLSDNRLGLRPLLSAPRGDSSILGKLSVVGGPIVQQTANAARVIWDMGPGDADDRTANAMRRLLVGAKWFHADGLMDVVEDGATALIE
jgi:hypothetical protein